MTQTFLEMCFPDCVRSHMAGSSSLRSAYALKLPMYWREVSRSGHMSFDERRFKPTPLPIESLKYSTSVTVTENRLTAGRTHSWQVNGRYRGVHHVEGQGGGTPPVDYFRRTEHGFAALSTEVQTGAVCEFGGQVCG